MASSDKITIVSIGWGEIYTRRFLRKLPRNAVFGFSGAFLKEDLQKLANQEGMSLDIVGEKHPLALGQDRDYLLRVVRPAISSKSKKKALILRKIQALKEELSLIEDLVKGAIDAED